jgi:hypothetical protein
VVQGTTGWDKRDVTEEGASAFKNAVDLEVGCEKGTERVLRPRRVSRELTGINRKG